MNATIEQEFYDTIQLLAKTLNETSYDQPKEEDFFRAWYTLKNYPLKSGLSIFLACSCLNLLNRLGDQEKSLYNLDEYFVTIYDTIKKCNSTLIDTYADKDGFVFFRFSTFIFSYSYKTTTSKDLIPKEYFSAKPIVFDNVRKKKCALTLFNMALQKISKYERVFGGKSLENILKTETEHFKKGGYIKESGSYKKVEIGTNAFIPINIEELKQKLESLKNQPIDDIPLDARPKTLDNGNKPYLIVSYSRQDFAEVYLFLAYLYNNKIPFWYDNGMLGAEKWLKEYQDKFENPNCIGIITFFSNNYVSNSIKEELSIIYENGEYKKKNIAISLMPIKEINANEMLINAIYNRKITIENACDIKPILTEIIEEEKQRTIHRYSTEENVLPIIEKIAKLFNL